MEATVSEIHGYPRRPEGYIEPLFHTVESKREIMDHLLEAPWLERASSHDSSRSHRSGQPYDLPLVIGGIGGIGGAGAGRALAEPRPVSLVRRRGDTIVDMGREVRRCAVRSGAIRRVLERWREVCAWWEDGGGRDLDVFRVELSCGAVVDLAQDRSVPDGEPGRWLLVGIPD